MWTDAINPIINPGEPIERRIKSTGQGMARYGACERCGKVCHMTYKQQWRKVGARGWISAGFGHVECLRGGVWDDAQVDHTEGSTP